MQSNNSDAIDEVTNLPYPTHENKLIHSLDSVANVSLAETYLQDAYRAIRIAESSPKAYQVFCAREELRCLIDDLLSDDPPKISPMDLKDRPLLFVAGYAALAWIRRECEIAEEGDATNAS